MSLQQNTKHYDMPSCSALVQRKRCYLLDQAGKRASRSV